MKVATDLNRFAEAKSASIKALKARTSWKPRTALRPGFREALVSGRKRNGLGIIAEYKRASPSLGDINLWLGPEEAGPHYVRADCLSVLTESTYFAGRLGFLEAMAFSGKPLLRKDFIFDPLQILETAETPASAVLLIVRLTPDAVLLKELKDTAEEYGLAPVVEIHDSGELELARRVGAKLIQFNSRDLRGLSVDPERIFDLAIREPPGPGELYVAASVLSTVRDLAEVEAAGFGAALMGTAFMRAQDPGLALGGLLDEFAAWCQKASKIKAPSHRSVG